MLTNAPDNAVPVEDHFERRLDPQRSRFHDLPLDVRAAIAEAVETERRYRWAVFGRYFEAPPAPLRRRRRAG